MPRSGGKCPVCRKPTVARYRPFCSGRCADIDLARWFTGAYRIANEEPAEDEDATRDDPGYDR
ncbi:MAG: DNA gyrase inhibitor YacG [Alphaproteobacteria bacterium]|nr:DNA gyrase inhibitor YacG [Alphaproteobacteria bacterium]